MQWTAGCRFSPILSTLAPPPLTGIVRLLCDTMRFCDNTTERSPARRHAATAFGVLTLLLAGLIVFMFVGDIFLAVAGQKDIGYGVVGGVMFFIITLPFALLCTLSAILLVGTRRCRLAWVTFCVVYVPLIFFTLGTFIYRHFIHSR